MSNGHPRIDRLGIVFVVVSSVCFGLLPLMARSAFSRGADAFGILTARYPTCLVLLLAGRILLPKVFRDAEWPRGIGLVKVLALGVIGYAGQAFCYFQALTLIPSSLDAVLLYTAPFVVVLWRLGWFGERLRPVTLACLVAAFVGCVMVVGPASSSNFGGIALGLGAGLCYGTYITWSTEVLKGLPGAWTNLTLVMAGSAITFTGLSPMTHPAFPRGVGGWVAIGAIAALGTCVGMGTLFLGLPRLGASVSAILANVEPFVSVLVGITILGESLQSLQVVGGLVLLTAIIVLATRGGSHPDHRPAAVDVPNSAQPPVASKA